MYWCSIPRTLSKHSASLATFRWVATCRVRKRRVESTSVESRFRLKFSYLFFFSALVAAGPIGRNAEASGSASLKAISAVYSYSKTKGFFAGVSLEGSVILTRGDANEKFYGRKVSSKELLDGTVPPPQEADALYRALNARFHTLGNTGAMYSRGSADGGSNGSPNSFSRSPTYKGSAGISAPGSLRQPPGSTRAPVAAPASNYHSQPAPPSYTQSAQAYGGQTQSYGGQPQTYGGQPQAYGGQPTPLSAVGTVRKPPPPPPSRRPQEPTARALYDFDGEQAGDLNFREGDIVTIVQKSDSQDDWWTGKIGNRQGIVSVCHAIKSSFTYDIANANSFQPTMSKCSNSRLSFSLCIPTLLFLNKSYTTLSYVSIRIQYTLGAIVALGQCGYCMDVPNGCRHDVLACNFLAPSVS